MTVYLGTTKMNSLSGRAKKKNKSKIQKNNNLFNLPSIILGLFIVLIFLILLYGFMINRVATIGYDIKTTEKKINELKNKNDNLKIKISELKSMESLGDKAVEIGMVEPMEIDYLSVAEGLALKR